MGVNVFVSGEERRQLGVSDLLRRLLRKSWQSRCDEQQEKKGSVHALLILVMLSEVEASLELL